MSDNTGRLIRSKLWFDGGFAMIPNAWARDSRISNQARGLLTQLVSHEPGFEVTIDGLTRGALNGRDAIRAQVGELERAGYLKRYRRRVKNRIAGIDWELTDPHSPVDKHGTPLAGLAELAAMGTKKPRSEQAPENQSPENQSPENQSPENPTTIEDQLKEDLTTSRRPTTEGPVDNSPGSAHDQGEIDAFGDDEQPASATAARDAHGWADARCPGNWKGTSHEVGSYGNCIHCYERPTIVYADAASA